MRSKRERRLDILEARERIEKYAEEGKDAFEAEAVWSVVECDLPELKLNIQAILKKL